MKYDIYTEVTNRIITHLEKGIVPWRSPFFSKVGFPTNFASKKQYRGINVFLLGSQLYTSPYFLTFKQAQELGGFVRKGEKGLLVIKYGTYSTKEEEVPTEDARKYLKAYTVFHASQIEGVDFPTPKNLAPVLETAATGRAREIVAGMPLRPAIKEGTAVPCYRPDSDSVHMPEKHYFENEHAYCSTLFHELSHATGHQSRLARKSLLENKGMDAEGTAKKIYAEEELVAEMSASFLSASAGIETGNFENSAAYISGWLDALKTKDAKNWIIRAASQAQKAADFILGTTPGQ